MCKLITPLLFCFLIFGQSYAQSGHWETYIGEWEKGPGSITFRMDLIKTAPIPQLPYLIATGIPFSKCRTDGLPEKEALDKVYAISDSLVLLVQRSVKNEFVGTFTYQCERLGYFYVADTMGIRSKLRQLYRMQFDRNDFYINIKKDEEWKTYREFLYPNEITMEYIQNEKVTSKLLEAGDDLSKPRQVDHWMYFKTENDRDNCEKELKKGGYKIEKEEKSKDKTNHFQLHFSRKDMVDLAAISKQTLSLEKMAAKFGGDYDGWETFVIE